MTPLCPFCGFEGNPVKPATLRALLNPHLRDQVHDEVYHFCGNPACHGVYFRSDGIQAFTKGELDVRVGLKEVDAPRPLCYCFGHSFESIRDEFFATGSSTAVEAIRAAMKGGTCRCEMTNPSGGCCLGAVIRAVNELQSEVPEAVLPKAHRGDASSRDCCALPIASDHAPLAAVRNGNDQETRRAAWAAAALGLLASACCWVPLALAGIGLTGGAVGAKVAWLRPWSLWSLALLLAGTVVWWGFHRFPKGQVQGACCLASPKFPTLPVVVLAVSLAGAWIAPRLLHAGANPPIGVARSGETHLVLSTPQFDCPSCVGAMPQSLAQTPGVASVQMDFDKKETRIAFIPGAEVDAILAGWSKDLGFSGKVVQRSGSPHRP